jgi:hypothetical protein
LPNDCSRSKANIIAYSDDGHSRGVVTPSTQKVGRPSVIAR